MCGLTPGLARVRATIAARFERARARETESEAGKRGNRVL